MKSAACKGFQSTLRSLFNLQVEQLYYEAAISCYVGNGCDALMKGKTSKGRSLKSFIYLNLTQIVFKCLLIDASVGRMWSQMWSKNHRKIFNDVVISVLNRILTFVLVNLLILELF